jgi:anti-sigma B factor antagonist
LSRRSWRLAEYSEERLTTQPLVPGRLSLRAAACRIAANLRGFLVMNHHEHPVSVPPHVRVVTLPADLEYGNAADACRPLTTGLPPGTTTVIADLTATTWCDTGGLHAIVSAHKLAAARGIELRWVIPAGPLTRILALTALDRWLPVYPSRAAALTAGPGRRAAP